MQRLLRIRMAGVSCLPLVMGLGIAMGGVPVLAGDDPIATCTQRLKAIHQALTSYEKKHQQWPDHLSDLVPELLPDQAALRDPADIGMGNLGSSEAHGDPKFRVSYSYERNGDASNGLAQPLGSFPKPDFPGSAWGTWRLVNGRMEAFFGDQVPVVRWYHHRPPNYEREPGRDRVLKLTPSGRVYLSDYDWRRHPDSIDFLLRTLDRDFSRSPAWVLRTWLLWCVDEFLSDDEGLSPAGHGPRMTALAESLLGRHRELPGEERTTCRVAARLFLKLGDLPHTHAALDAASKFSAAEWQQVVEGQLRAQAFHAAQQWEQEIAVYHELLVKNPGVQPYMESLAAAYDDAGKPERAREWRDKADPGRALIGQPAPPFQITLESGSSLTLEAALDGRKGVLLDFWFCGCEPCRREFPFLKQIHLTYKSQGLAIVAVNFGDSKDAIARFTCDHNVSFSVGVGRQGEEDNPIFRAYHVASYPTSFLIDGSGRIVWRGVGFGPELKSELTDALGRLSLKP